jgi:DNA-directed RNA polymerase subunit RPC12/RpoP
MSLMQSAIDAIDIGVEDFQSADNRRMASAVRNFYAGVLLLLKEKLRLESPPGSNEVLLYERLRLQKSSTGLTFVGTGKKTVNQQGIVERFKQLGLKLDDKRLKRLADIRNDFEHHVSKRPTKEVQAAIEATFVLVFSILEDHLGLRPSAVFKPETWDVMLAEAETYKEMADRCRKSIEAITDTPAEATDALELIECPSCGSELLYAELVTYYGCEFTCSACGEQTELSEVIERALADAYAGITYERVKDGDDAPIGTCPHCSLETFSIDADRCLACGEGRAFEDCLRCGASLELYEQDNGFCGYCNHVIDKDD